MNIFRKILLLSLVIFFLVASAQAQSTILYRAFNPGVDTCSDASTVIIYNISAIFTPGTFKCTGGVYVAFDIGTGGGGNVTGTGITNRITRWQNGAGGILENSMLSDNTTDRITVNTNPATFSFNIGTIADIFNITGNANAFRDIQVRNIFLDGATPNSVCTVSSLKLLTCGVNPTDGQIIIGDSLDAPVIAAPTGTAPIVATLGAGSLNFSCPSCSRTLFSNNTAGGNIGAGEDNLLSFTIPANTLGTNLQTIDFRASISFSADAENKRVRVRFGNVAGVVIFDTTALSTFVSDTAELTCEISRIAADSQKCVCALVTSDTSSQTITNVTTVGEDSEVGMVIKITGEATTTDAIIANFWRGTLNGAP